MSVRRLRLLGDPILREKARPVAAVDSAVQELIHDLRDTMYEADGIGLAATQIGVPLRVFVYDIQEEGAAGALVNPEIVEWTGKVKEEEGCLSIPGLSEIVERSERIVLRALDPTGQEVRLEASGLLSRCLQHECDHLDGVLFLDRVSPLKRKLLLKKWSKMEQRERREGVAL